MKVVKADINSRRKMKPIEYSKHQKQVKSEVFWIIYGHKPVGSTVLIRLDYTVLGKTITTNFFKMFWSEMKSQASMPSSGVKCQTQELKAKMKGQSKPRTFIERYRRR